MRVYVKKSHCKRGHELNHINRENGTGQCKICKRDAVKSFLKANPNYRKEWRKRHKERLRLEHVSRYGISSEEYTRLLNKQDNKCAICGLSFGINYTPHVDHNHETQRVRGLLCRKCNSGLGQFEDSTINLQQAIVYLKEG